MQEVSAEIGANDINVIRQIFHKHSFMQYLGLKPSKHFPVRMMIPFFQSDTNNLQLQHYNNDRPTYGWSTDTMTWLYGNEKSSINRYNEELSNLIGIPKYPAETILYPIGRNTGLNGNYWSRFLACREKSKSKRMLTGFEVCSLCQFKSQISCMIACDKCIQWFHLKCAKIPRKSAMREENYFCKFCNQSKQDMELVNKNLTTPLLWKGCPCGNSKRRSLMIACDKCDRWFHCKCAKISKKKCTMIERYYCKSCIMKNLKYKIIYKGCRV